MVEVVEDLKRARALDIAVTGEAKGPRRLADRPHGTVRGQHEGECRVLSSRGCQTGGSKVGTLFRLAQGVGRRPPRRDEVGGNIAGNRRPRTLRREQFIHAEGLRDDRVEPVPM